MSAPAIVLWLVFGIMITVSAGWGWAMWLLWRADQEDDEQ